MTHRERALTTLRGGQPDYVPTFELVFHETERDFGGRTFYGAAGSPIPAGVERREIVEHNARLYVDVARRFEHSIIHLPSWKWPFVRHFDQTLDLVKRVRELTGDEFCLTAPGDPTFKIPKDFMTFSVRTVEDAEGLKADARRNVEAHLPIYDALKQAGADGIIMTSDYAFNSGTFLSPGQFGEFVTPYLAQAVRAVHDRGMVCIKHTDGNLMGVMDQIADAGPDALHSIDPMAGMDIRLIKEKYGRRLCLCGNVHCAWMQTGTPGQIRQSAEYCLQWAKPGGGYVFSTSNCVFRGMPLESYDLIHRIWREHRAYRPEGET